MFSFCQLPLGVEEQIALLQSGILCTAAGDEKRMLTRLRHFLNTRCTSDTQLVTFNGKAFDLRKLRFRYARYGMALPDILTPYAPQAHLDLMLFYTRYFTIKNTPYISLSEVVQQLGISKGKICSGAQVCEMLEAKAYVTLLLYNALDCLLTEKVYSILTSQTQMWNH
jgi:uncharacterized protein YprB with RNaseH-like and TPR domain